MHELNPFDGLGSSSKYIGYNYTNKDKQEATKKFPISYLEQTLANNKLFPENKLDYYNKFNRYGFIDPYHHESVSTEYLFFTKPDLCIYGKSTDNGIRAYSSSLNPDLANIPFFIDADKRNGPALKQLQYSVKDTNGVLNPFMYLLSNSLASKLDLPSITSESKESTSNIMGTSIQYRGHSIKSDNGYDFSLSFSDTAYLEIYMMVKAYDEYMRLIKTGEASPMRKYITNRIAPEQFSIYKFLIGEDGETILYYAKLTGCYFTDVPRDSFGDPGNDGFKFSLSFHAQFVEDNNPMILEEFNRLSPAKSNATYSDVYNSNINTVNNDWKRWPRIVAAYSTNDKRVIRRGTKKDYRMKWV